MNVVLFGDGEIPRGMDVHRVFLVRRYAWIDRLRKDTLGV